MESAPREASTVSISVRSTSDRPLFPDFAREYRGNTGCEDQMGKPTNLLRSPGVPVESARRIRRFRNNATRRVVSPKLPPLNFLESRRCVGDRNAEYCILLRILHCREIRETYPVSSAEREIEIERERERARERERVFFDRDISDGRRRKMSGY